jgi:hypothetical protein
MELDVYHPRMAPDPSCTSLELPSSIAEYFERQLRTGRVPEAGAGLRHPDTGANVSLLMMEVGYADRYEFAVLERVETVELIISNPGPPSRAFVRCWRA